MMKHEFEQLAGYSVSSDDYYKIIEPMYIAADIDKVDFIKCLNRERFEIKVQKTKEQIEFENTLKREIDSLKETIAWYKDQIACKKSLIDSEDDEKWLSIWKADLKTYKQEIKLCKRRILTLRLILE